MTVSYIYFFFYRMLMGVYIVYLLLLVLVVHDYLLYDCLRFQFNKDNCSFQLNNTLLIKHHTDYFILFFYFNFYLVYISRRAQVQ